MYAAPNPADSGATGATLREMMTNAPAFDSNGEPVTDEEPEEDLLDMDQEEVEGEGEPRSAVRGVLDQQLRSLDHEVGNDDDALLDLDQQVDLTATFTRPAAPATDSQPVLQHDCEYLNAMQKAIDECTTGREFLARIAELRLPVDRARRVKAVPLSAAAEAHRGVVLRTADGDAMDVGAVLREHRQTSQSLGRMQQTQSRLARWQKRVPGPGGHAFARTDALLKTCGIWLLTTSPEVIILAQVLGAFQTYKNGSKPFKEIILQNVNSAQLRLFKIGEDGMTCTASGFTVCKTAQQLLHLVDPDSFEWTTPTTVFKFKEAGAGRSLVEQFTSSMSDYWRDVINAKAAKSAPPAEESAAAGGGDAAAP